MTKDEITRLAEAIELPIDSDLVWELSIWNSGKSASATLISPSKIDSKYDDILSGAVHKTLAMAMAVAWADWKEKHHDRQK